MSSLSIEMEKRNYIVHPQKFALWLFILTVIIIFGGLTSAYIVQRSFVPDPIVFDLPSIIWYNLAIILFSSVTMQFAVWANQRGESRKAMFGLTMTMILGVVFLAGQYQAWGDLNASGLPLVDIERSDNSISYFYIFTGLHGAHIIGTLIALLITMIRTSLDNFLPGRKSLVYELTSIFWHFLGLLWVYLFIFLQYTQN